MLLTDQAFGGFSVDDIKKAKQFYGDTLGMDVKDGPMGTLNLSVAGGGSVMIYPKPDHKPAVFTVLNIPVDDIDTAVDELASKGVEFEQYDQPEIKTDEKGIARERGGKGPSVAWLKDPAGNIIALLQFPK